MSTQPTRVQADILGQTVTADVVDRIPQADAGQGPTTILVVEVNGSTFRVDESETQPR
jgi:hypothetical protein